MQSDDIVFEPVVQLEEVEVKTGEEDETCIYSQRSKLFKHTDNQWKERGIGEMKILQHNQTGNEQKFSQHLSCNCSQCFPDCD